MHARALGIQIKESRYAFAQETRPALILFLEPGDGRTGYLVVVMAGVRELNSNLSMERGLGF